jgi:hypothetical protein
MGKNDTVAIKLAFNARPTTKNAGEVALAEPTAEPGAEDLTPIGSVRELT